LLHRGALLLVWSSHEREADEFWDQEDEVPLYQATDDAIATEEPGGSRIRDAELRDGQPRRSLNYKHQ